MPIRQEHQPPARTEGHPPDGVEYVSRLAESWHYRYKAEGNDEKAMSIPDRRWRASWAANCNRATAYLITRTEESNPVTIADAWRFSLGNFVHEAVQQDLIEAFPGVEVEVPVDLRPIGIDGAATADVLGDVDGVRTAMELKSINGFGFKMAATSFKSPPEGPRHSALVQGALAATAGEAERLIIGYLSLENVSPQLASYTDSEIGRFAAEWHYTPDEFRPIAMEESERVANILTRLDQGWEPAQFKRRIPDPDYPKRMEVTDPSTGHWIESDPNGAIISTGRAWQCAYCPFRDRCIADGG
jgi:hypothetical protein